MKTYKLFSGLFLIIALTAVTNAQDNSSSISPLYDGPNWGTITDTGITCSGGPLVSIIRDDGSYENGYRSVSTGDSTTMVQKMVMPSLPFNLVSMCVVWTSLSQGSNITFDLIFYDTTGAGGTAPGNVVYRVNSVVANSIALFPGHSRYSYPINYVTTQRAYFVGVRWNNNPILPFFLSADENGPVSSMGPGYQRVTTTYPPTWQNISTPFPAWKSWGVRLEGTAPPPPPFGQQLTLCRSGINVPILDIATARDSMQVVLGSPCVITDVNVRIDTVVHTWDGDLTFILSKGSTSVVIINQVGGSGDNFIGTILNDSATTPIASGTAPFTGSYRPSNPLTPFYGPFVSGFWVLSISDGFAGDTGFLRRWCLVFTYTTTDCTGIQQTVEIPNYYSLSQNYPNPFNPVTSIKFTLPQSENVKLVVFDILGREVKTLVNEFRHQGVYEVSFDASSLSSGAYFYRLDAGEFTATKKMFLIK